MAEYCIKCKKKIGFWDDAFYYVDDTKPMCKECAQPVLSYFSKLGVCNGDELANLEVELRKICMDNFDNYIANSICNNFHQRRVVAGLLSKEEKHINESRKLEFDELVKTLPITTTQSFEGYVITKYVDVVCEEVIFKNSLWKRLDAGLEDIVNTLSFSQTEMSGATELIANARKYVLDKFKLKVAKLGANAVVGVEFESSFGSDVVRVAVFGTAVIISKINEKATEE